MPKTPIQEAISSYQRLSSADRKKFRMFVNGAPGGKDEPRSATNNESNDWLLSGILSELKTRGMTYTSRAIRTWEQSLTYAEESAAVRKELLRVLKLSIPQPKYQELLSLGRVVARALIRTLGSKTYISLKVLLNNVGKALEAIDNAFPGYMASGLLGHLVKTFNI
jgi:hypothetical protein